jgi:uncharacterized protein YqhQ
VGQFYYGGQALIEGVMMRGRSSAVAAVRDRAGRLVTREERFQASAGRLRLFRLPLIRGVVALWETVVLGTRMMLFSADVQSGAAERGEGIPRTLVFGMMTISGIVAVLLFFVLPLLGVRAHSAFFGSAITSGITEGVVRLAIFLGYLLLIGRLERMGRVFEYHGAEHKTINAYEQGAPLTIQAVQRFSTIHVRCGTAFLLWIVVISIVVFAALGHSSLSVSILQRVILVPLIAGVSYEILRLSARFYRYGPVRLLVAPGLWLQRLTTREPSDGQVEVAIAALQAVLVADGTPVVCKGPVGLPAAETARMRS